MPVGAASGERARGSGEARVGDALTLRVESVARTTHAARVVRLALAGVPFHYAAGQAAMLGLHGQALRKPYSIACAPEQASRDEALEFLIKVDRFGSPGQHLAGLRSGSLVDVEGPIGAFSFPADPAERRFLFVAGGTGISALRAMLWHVLLARPADRAAVIYSARTPRDFAYGGELRRLSRERRIHLTLTATRDAGRSWRGDRGRINAARLGRLLDHEPTLCFLCGPPALVEAVAPLLRHLGVADNRIRMEEW
jgi:ferredoxin-NADP reductase